MLGRELFKLRGNSGISLSEMGIVYSLDVDDGFASIIKKPNNVLKQGPTDSLR